MIIHLPLCGMKRHDIIKMLDHGEVFAAEQKVNVRQDPATGNEKD